MYYAKERRNGQIIAASKAHRWGNYRCPTCNVEVSLRSGKYRDAHFAHKPGQGKPECEEFHPSDDLRHPWRTTETYQGPPIDPLRLSVELEPGYDAHRGPRKWLLRLTVPKSPDEHGRVSIDCGGGDVKTITLSKLALGPQTYLADPDAQDFGASWVSPEVRPPYRVAVEHRIPGLSSRVANVFGAARAKLKPQSNIFHWGESYYLVWSVDKPITFPASILNHEFAANRGWCCSLIGLPNKADPEIAAWLTQTCDLPIAPSKREWALLYPGPYAVDDDGNLQVSSCAQLILAIQPVDDGAPGKVIGSVGQTTASTTLTGASRHFVEIAVPEQMAQKPIYLAWDDAFLATVIAKPHPNAATGPAILLEFEGGAAKESAALHHVHCQELLALVRLGQRTLSGVRGHSLLRGHLCWRPNAQFEWECDELDFSSAGGQASQNDALLPSQRIDRINSALQDHSIDVSLDFGAFGTFHATAVPQDIGHTSSFRIQPDLRQRLEWLCKASGAFVNSQHRAVGLLNDEALLLHFSQVAVPRALAAHQRAVEHELRRAAKMVSS
jgi:hypothetical protein